MKDKGESSANIFKSSIVIFMCGDVMLGRGIDQVMPHPGNPEIYEEYMKSAKGYVEIAERINGPIPSSRDYSYVWGGAIEDLKRISPDLKIINLETSVTRSNDYWREKEINYRMNPENVSCLTEVEIDCCSLANNHVLDWGYSGLKETLEILNRAGIKNAGAGRTLEEAQVPAVMEVKEGCRVLMFSYGVITSGIPLSWKATHEKPGINLIEDLTDERVKSIGKRIEKIKAEGDIVIMSIHWGGNWGYEIPLAQIEFAHKLIDKAGVDVIHGHSSHHIKGVEVYKDKLIVYGCGDFLNDYEGIRGYEYFRDDLGLMYFVSVEPSTGRLLRLQMIPTQIRCLRVNKASEEDAIWLKDILNREGRRFGTQVTQIEDGTLFLEWV